MPAASASPRADFDRTALGLDGNRLPVGRPRSSFVVAVDRSTLPRYVAARPRVLCFTP